MADQKTPQEIADQFLAKLKDSPFILVGPTDGSSHHEPLTAQIDDDRPNTLYFFVGRDNRLADGGDVMACYTSKGHDFFACLHGRIVPDNDPAEVDKLWNNHLEAWFPNGKADALLLRLDVDDAELWETDISLSGRVKMLFGGTIKPSESSSHAHVDSVA